MTKCLDIQIRWLIRRDMPELLQIERDVFPFPWTDDDFMRCLKEKSCIGMVAKHEHLVVGYMIYELQKSRLVLLNFAVDAAFQRQGVGRQMIERLTDKLSNQRRHEIWMEVRERNVIAQLFLRSQRFRAVLLLRKHYDETEEDCYLMRFAIDAEQRAEQSPFHPSNRISAYIDS